MSSNTTLSPTRRSSDLIPASKTKSCGSGNGGNAITLRQTTSGDALMITSDLTALREVRSEVIINASPEVVWRNVIAFPPLPEPHDFVFDAGIRSEERRVGESVVFEDMSCGYQNE